MLEKDRLEAVIRNEVYRRRMMRDYNKRVRHGDFQVGDMVLWKTTLNTRNPTEGKLGVNWKGPYVVCGLRKNGTYELMGYE